MDVDYLDVIGVLGSVIFVGIVACMGLSILESKLDKLGMESSKEDV